MAEIYQAGKLAAMEFYLALENLKSAQELIDTCPLSPEEKLEMETVAALEKIHVNGSANMALGKKLNL